MSMFWKPAGKLLLQVRGCIVSTWWRKGGGNYQKKYPRRLERCQTQEITDNEVLFASSASFPRTAQEYRTANFRNLKRCTFLYWMKYRLYYYLFINRKKMIENRLCVQRNRSDFWICWPLTLLCTLRQKMVEQLWN